MFGWDDEEHSDAVPADSFDRAGWNEMRMESLQLENMIKNLSKTHDYVEDFTQDVFNLLLKSQPRVREAAEMKDSHVPLRQVTDEVSGMPELERLRENTVGDAFNVAMAMGSLQAVIEEGLKRAGGLADQAKKAAEAAQAAQQAAQDSPGSEEAEGAAAAAQEAASALDAAAAAQSAGMRAQIRRELNSASQEIEDLEDAGTAYGIGPGEFRRMPAAERFALAKRLRSNKLKEFAALIGQFRNLAAAEYRRRFTNGSEEEVGIKLGDDLTRLVGQELLNLASPDLEEDFWLRYANRELWVKEMRGTERAGKGPIIVVVDESGSMAGECEMWAKGLALALLDQAHKGKRDFHYIGFASTPKLREFDYPGGVPDMAKTLQLAEGFLNGGTDFSRPLRRALDLALAAGKERPDIVFITDGMAPTPSFINEWKSERDRLSIRCYAIAIGSPTEGLEDIADNVRTIADLTDASQVADILRT